MDPLGHAGWTILLLEVQHGSNGIAPKIEYLLAFATGTATKMGIDLLAESDTLPTLFAKDDPNKYLKYAWMDIDWREIFDILHINLHALYDNHINYWAPCHVRDMRDEIKNFVDKTIWIPDDDHENMKEKMDLLHDDAVKLLKFFDFYVENNVKIHVL